jgi:DNA-binding CsgD family transcriptional regulator
MGNKAENLTSILLIGKSLLGSATLREFHNNLFQYTLPLFDARACVFSLVKNGMIDAESTIWIGIRKEHWLDDYREDFFELDPLLRAPYVPFNHNVYTTEDVITYRNLQSSRFYDHLKECDVYSELFVNLTSQGEIIGNVIYARPKRMQPFQEKDKVLAGLLQPCLSAALEKIIVLEKSIGYSRILNSVISRSKQTGIMLLNNSLEPIHKNDSADDTLALLYAKNESRQELPQSILVKCNELLSQIRRSENKLLRPDDIGRFQLDFQITQGKEDLQVTLQPVLLAQGEIFLLLFMEPRGINSQLHKLGKYFRLTEREIEVVNLLFSGMSSAEIADKLFISAHTVNNHVQAIFEKMDVKNRGGLISKLVSLT